MKNCLIFLTILLLACVLRFKDIDSAPPGFSGHGMVHAQLRIFYHDALFQKPIDAHEARELFMSVMGEQHGPQSFLEALFIPLFGSGFDEIRTFVATLGVLSIVAAFLCGYAAGGILLGFLLMFFTTVSQWHLVTSRYGDSEHILIFLHGYLLLLSSLLLISKKTVGRSLLFGATLGLSIYIYATNQFLSLIVASLFAIMFMQENRPQSFLKLGAVFLLTLAVTAGPQIYFNSLEGKLLPLRSSTGGVGYEPKPLSEIGTQSKKLFGEFFVACQDPWYSLERGALMEAGFIFIIPALLWLLAASPNRKMQLYKWISVACVFLGLLPSVITPDAPFRRASLTYFGLVLLSSGGALWVWQWLAGRNQRLLLSLLILIVGIGLYYQSYDFIYNRIAPYESVSGRSFVAVARTVRAQNAANLKIYIGEKNWQSDRDTIERFTWFNVLSSKGVKFSSTLHFPDLYLNSHFVLQDILGKTVLVPEFFNAEFMKVLGELSINVETLRREEIKDRLGVTVLRYSF